MIDIRYNKKYSKVLEKDFSKSVLNKSFVTIVEDPNVEDVVIMVHSNGSFVEWSRGIDNARSLLKKGYVDIRRNCPLRHRKCIGSKCSFSHIKNMTQDCAIIWNVV